MDRIKKRGRGLDRKQITIRAAMIEVPHGGDGVSGVVEDDMKKFP